MPSHKPSQLKLAAKNMYTNMVAVYGLRSASKVCKQVRLLLKDERLRRSKLPKGEQELEDETAAKANKKTRSGKTAKSKKPKGPGVFASLCALFDKKGVNKVTHAEAKACAKEAKPDSNLSQGHWKWYMKKYKALSPEKKVKAKASTKRVKGEKKHVKKVKLSKKAKSRRKIRR